MQIKWPPILLIQIVLLAGGCEKKEPVAPSTMHQILGSLQIPDKGQRDTALSEACRESARVGDVESILLGIPKLSSDKLRDDVAQECAEIFVAADRNEAAQRLCELISDVTIRKKVSGAIAAE